jgi:tight adherence protein C
VTLILLAGGLAGLGLLLLGLLLVPPRMNPAAALVRLDAERGRASAERMAVARLDAGQTLEPRMLRELGSRVHALSTRSGLELGGLRADLSLLGRSLETHLAITVLAAVAGFVAPVLLGVLLTVAGAGTSFGGVSGMVGIVAAAVAGLLPSLLVRPQATQRRQDFRHVVGSFLDLVAMNLAGGRGVPEALKTAAEVSDGWAMVRIRDTLLSARLHGVTPWAALGELGREVKVDELVDLAAALTLVAEDGAKVRESLAARAMSMRKRELAEAEGKAGERSQSMLVAQLVLCVGFLIFLVYPALAQMLGA